jgi:hypothetical protein
MAIAHPKKATSLAPILEMIENNYQAAVMHCCLRLVQAEPDYEGNELQADELIDRLHAELTLVKKQRGELQRAAFTLRDHQILY